MYKCTNVQVYNCTSVQAYKCTSVHMFKCTTLQVYKCTTSTSDRGNLFEFEDNRCLDNGYLLVIERVYASSKVIGVGSTVIC